MPTVLSDAEGVASTMKMTRHKSRRRADGNKAYVDFEARAKSALLGTFRVAFDNLAPEPSLPSAVSNVEPKRIRQLLENFALEGCLRCEASNRIPVVVQKSKMLEILSENGITGNGLSRAPCELVLKVNRRHLPLYFLEGRGRHRLLAAKTYLEPRDQWWAVDFYAAEDVPDDLLRFMRDYADHTMSPTDGTVCRKICHFRQLGDSESARKWLARLSHSKRRDLRQLEHHRLSRPIHTSLNKLLVFPGLWDSFEIGTLHRILPMRCPEEIVNYLENVHTIWSGIVELDRAGLVDTHTVEQVQGRCPAYSLCDREYLECRMGNGALFPQEKDPAIREQIKKRICEVRQIIPSIKTFLEATKWPESCHRVLRLLVPRRRYSFRQTLLSCWIRQVGDEHVEQIAENNFQTIHVGKVTFWGSYVELFWVALREFPSLTELSPRLERKKRAQIPCYTRNSAEALYRLCSLAQRLGFTSPQIESVLGTEESRAVAQDMLRKARPTRLYEFGEGQLSSSISLISHTLQQAYCIDSVTRIPELVSDVRQNFDLRLRCGRIFEESFKFNHGYIFRSHIYADHPIIPRRDITSLMVIVNTFHAFFGSQREVGRDEDYFSDSEDAVSITDEDGMSQETPNEAIQQPALLQTMAQGVAVHQETTDLRQSLPINVEHRTMQRQLMSEATVLEGTVAEKDICMETNTAQQDTTYRTSIDLETLRHLDKHQDPVTQKATQTADQEQQDSGANLAIVELTDRDSTMQNASLHRSEVHGSSGQEVLMSDTSLALTITRDESPTMVGALVRNSVSTMFGDANISRVSLNRHRPPGVTQKRGGPTNKASKTSTALVRREQTIQAYKDSLKAKHLLHKLKSMPKPHTRGGENAANAAGKPGSAIWSNTGEHDVATSSDTNDQTTTLSQLAEQRTSASDDDNQLPHGKTNDTGIPPKAGNDPSSQNDSDDSASSVIGLPEGRRLSATEADNETLHAEEGGSIGRVIGPTELGEIPDTGTALQLSHIDGDSHTASTPNTSEIDRKRKFGMIGALSIPFEVQSHDKDYISLLFHKQYLHHERLVHSEIDSRLDQDLGARIVKLNDVEKDGSWSVDLLRATQDGSNRTRGLISLAVKQECIFSFPIREKLAYESTSSQMLLKILAKDGRIDRPVLVLPKGKVYAPKMGFEPTVLDDPLKLPYYADEDGAPGWKISVISVVDGINTLVANPSEDGMIGQKRNKKL